MISFKDKDKKDLIIIFYDIFSMNKLLPDQVHKTYANTDDVDILAIKLVWF